MRIRIYSLDARNYDIEIMFVSGSRAPVLPQEDVCRGELVFGRYLHHYRVVQDGQLTRTQAGVRLDNIIVIRPVVYEAISHRY